jgi:hypothetical protein
MRVNNTATRQWLRRIHLQVVNAVIIVDASPMASIDVLYYQAVNGNYGEAILGDESNRIDRASVTIA